MLFHRFAVTLLTALVLSPIGLGAACAQEGAVPAEPASTTATYGDWVVHCVTVAGAGERTCEAVQTVQVEGQAQPVAQLAIGRLPGAAERTLTAVLPVNIALAVAAHVSGNAKSGAEEVGGVDLAWQRCFAGSCAASNLLPERALASLRGGTAGRLNFTDAGGNAVGIPLSWKGLDQALSAMETMKQ